MLKQGLVNSSTTEMLAEVSFASEGRGCPLAFCGKRPGNDVYFRPSSLAASVLRYLPNKWPPFLPCRQVPA